MPEICVSKVLESIDAPLRVLLWLHKNIAARSGTYRGRRYLPLRFLLQCRNDCIEEFRHANPAAIRVVHNDVWLGIPDNHDSRWFDRRLVCGERRDELHRHSGHVLDIADGGICRGRRVLAKPLDIPAQQAGSDGRRQIIHSHKLRARKLRKASPADRRFSAAFWSGRETAAFPCHRPQPAHRHR